VLTGTEICIRRAEIDLRKILRKKPILVKSIRSLKKLNMIMKILKKTLYLELILNLDV